MHCHLFSVHSVVAFLYRGFLPGTHVPTFVLIGCSRTNALVMLEGKFGKKLKGKTTRRMWLTKLCLQFVLTTTDTWCVRSCMLLLLLSKYKRRAESHDLPTCTLTNLIIRRWYVMTLIVGIIHGVFKVATFLGCILFFIAANKRYVFLGHIASIHNVRCGSLLLQM